METAYFPIHDLSRSDEIFITGIYDAHIGPRDCDIKLLEEHVEWVRSHKNAYWFGGGDVISAISPHDKRYQPGDIPKSAKQDNLIYEQCELAKTILEPIKHKCIGLLEGNHEAKCRSQWSISPTDILSYMLKTKNLSGSALIRLSFHRKGTNSHRIVDIHARHGNGSAKKAGAKIDKVGEVLPNFEADIYWGGHTHGKGGIPIDRMYCNSQMEIYPKRKLLVCGGSYQQAYCMGESQFAETVNVQPVPLGSSVVVIKPFVEKYIKGNNTATALAPRYEILNDVVHNYKYFKGE